jgi:hypothetical protein
MISPAERTRAPAFTTAALALSLIASCSFLANFEVPFTSSADAGDESGSASAFEAGSHADAARGSGAGAIVSTGFEEGEDGCGFTRLLDGTAAIDSEARSGSRSCRLCATRTNKDILAVFDIADPKPGTYRVSAWFRVPPGAASPPRWMVRVTATPPPGTDAATVFETMRTGDVDQTWRLAQAFLVVPSDPERTLIVLGALNVPAVGDCLLLDDVDVSYEP